MRIPLDQIERIYVDIMSGSNNTIVEFKKDEYDSDKIPRVIYVSANYTIIMDEDREGPHILIEI